MRRKVKRNHGRSAVPDERGSNKNRAARKKWLLSEFGDGKEAECVHCGKVLNYDTVTADRIVPGEHGGSYRRGNIWPSCDTCNFSRNQFKDYKKVTQKEARELRKVFGDKGIDPYRVKKNPRRRKRAKQMRFSKKFKAAYKRRKAA